MDGSNDLELPKRPRARPLIIARTGLVCWTMPWRRARRDLLTVICKATCDLVPERPATHRAEGDPPMGDLYWDDDPAASLRYPSDFAPIKVKADVVLLGTAFAPRPTASAGHVLFRFGHRDRGFERRVAVLGPRRWQDAIGGRVASKPAPFTSVPLRPELAFGGPGFGPNPVGRGHRGAAGPDGLAWLPQLETPDRLVRSPRDEVRPALLGPIAPEWPERWRGLGTYDATWLAERWPDLPDDFDYQHYQAAPEPQRLEPLQGDEPFEIAGVRADGTILRGSLPGVRPCCQQCQRRGGAVRLTPVALRLDTVVLDTDALTLHLVWRGVLSVSARHAPELDALYVTTEPVGSPLSDGEVRVALAAELALRTAPVLALAPVEDAPPLPEPLEQERAAELRAEVCRRLESGGVLAGLELAGADLSGLDLHGKVLTDTSLQRASLRGACLEDADLTGAQLAGADLGAAVLTRAKLVGADLSGALLEDARLDEADIERASFIGCRAARADLRAARGAGARFAEADLSDAVLTDAVLPGADFSGTKLDRTRLERASLPRVRLYDAVGTEARFDGAELTAARADAARLGGCSFREARAAGSVWDDATLNGCDFFGADLTGASFAAARCRGILFSRAALGKAVLRDADLERASLLQADLAEASLESTMLRGADLRGANLYRAETLQANLTDAKLDRANTAGTKLAGGRR